MSRPLIGYIIAATCLTAVVVSEERRTNAEITDAIIDLQVRVQGLDKEFCERINDMHVVRGFKVMDCEAGKVILRPRAQYRKEEDEAQDGR